jgi:hypothetical protein
LDESYHITPIDHPDPLQAEILASWQGNSAKSAISVGSAGPK